MLLKKLALLLPWKRKAQEALLEEELRSHIELAAQEARGEGATPEEALAAGQRDLGSKLRAQEDARGVWGFHPVEQFQRDCVYSLRSLRHSPSFTLVAILSLGLGIGSATAVFSLVNTVLLKPLAYRQPNQLVNIREIVAPLSNTYPSLPVNFQHFLFWREHAHSFTELAALVSDSVYLTGSEPLKVDLASVSANFFALLGVEPQIGRSFVAEEGLKGHEHVVILTDTLWSRRFGRDPALLGKTIVFNYMPYTVVGILGPQFHFFKNSDLGPLNPLAKNTEAFVPLTGTASGPEGDWGGDFDFAVFGRVNGGVSIAQAAAELDVLEHRIDVEYHLREGLRVVCAPVQDMVANPVRRPLYVLLTAVLLLLLIVCANLANLVLARSSARVREFSIRVALGAGKARLMVQIVIETLMLGLAGGTLGLGLALAAVNGFAAHTRLAIPRLDEVQIDARVYLFSVLVSLACGLLSGLLPAFRMTKVDSQESLRAGTHIPAGTRQSLRLREILIGSEVAITVVLLFGAGLLTASLARLLKVDKGFTTEQGIAFGIVLPNNHYKTPQEERGFWDPALQALRSAPGVKSAAYISKLPLTGESMVNDVTPEGASGGAVDPTTKKSLEINVRFISPEYFATMGIPLVQGRALEAFDRDRPVSVISARLAEKVWPGQNPLGRKFTTGSMVGKVTIVGVVKDVHTTGLDRETTMMAYVPFLKRALGGGTLVVRTSGSPEPLIATLRQRIKDVDPTVPTPEIETIGQLVTESLSTRYFQARLSNGFGFAALLLALIGIYGVVAYSAVQRRTEIAIRLALGATRGDVLGAMLRFGFRPVLVGFLAGWLAALLSAQFIRSLLFGVKSNDPLIMMAVFALLAGSAFAACMLPARSAVRVDPATALRYE
ncbi:MAG: ABC transporter permease [Acidobacteriaceae bacterium]|nr:ABC transporter permease [Acidobacteriaceae bacterium]